MEFPPSFESYGDAEFENVPDVLINRIKLSPFNLVATLIFLCAIVHTFMVGKFMAMSEARRKAHEQSIVSGEADENSVDAGAEFLHFMGEIEVVFGVWAVPLIVAIVLFYDWPTAVHYVEYGINLTEAVFVVVIMVLASTRPILKLAESLMLWVTGVLGGTLSAFWLTVMTIGPMLGSFITEPAAMTICALLLSHRFYDLEPSTRFKYATLGLLFVNVSVGGTLTHFAAPPILMVAGPWDWGTTSMLTNMGWKAVVGILLGNGLYFWMFRRELEEMQDEFALRSLKDDIARRFVPRDLVDREWVMAEAEVRKEQQMYDYSHASTTEFASAMRNRIEADLLPQLTSEGVDAELIKDALDKRFEEVVMYKLRRSLPGLLPEDERPEFHDPHWDKREDPVPGWIMTVHVMFMGWTIVNAHHPAFFMLGFLFFIGFARITAQYQNRISLQQAILVGFFLAGLVVHGGLQGWWIAPVLGGLSELPLMLGATILTAFNDNTAITYLSTLVPGLTDGLKYSVVAGAVTGGGLTVIANAPNPAGQSILKKHFDLSVSPSGLLAAALIPTIVLFLCFALL